MEGGFSEMRKKKILTLLLILCTITFLNTGCQRVMIQGDFSGPVVKAAKIPAKEAPAVALPSVTDPNLFIQCQKDGNVSDEIVEIVNQQLSILPANLRNAFTEDGWSIYVTDININQTYYGGQYASVMATTNYEEQRILVESRQDAAYESPIHEIGHWFDYYVGFPSYTEEFASVYSAESGIFTRSYDSFCVTSAPELFAEGFWQYIIDPNRLKSISPGLYQFIHNQYCQLCLRIAASMTMNAQSVFKNNSIIIGLT